MKKILLVTRPIAPPWDEASKNFAYNLAKNISAENLELHLMTSNVLDDIPKKIIQENIYTHSQNDFTFSQKIKSLFFQLKNRRDFDILHYFFTPTKLNSFIIKNFIKNSSSKSIQTIATLREDLFTDEEIKKIIFADHIITYSDYAKNKLKALGFKKVERIYPGIDLEKYKLKQKNETLMKNFSFSLSDFIIHFSGEYVRLGAMDDVIDAFIEVCKKIPNAKLLLAVRVKNEKDALKKNEIIKKLKAENILEKVAFFDNGKYPMEDIYNLADISLFPVRNMHGKFDIPLVVIEAMACQKPVIISDIPILQEFSNKNNSIQIKSGDVKELFISILELYNNKELSELLKISSRKYVEENFNINSVAKKYQAIYQKI